jgi:hypothetical protein
MNELTAIFARANENGKNYLSELIKRKTIISVFNTSENWFYVLTDPEAVFYISQKYDCKSGYFGDFNHLVKTLKND